MFFNGINEFESKFKLLDRLNIMVFNIWRDKNAIAYRDGDIARITNEYRRYISKVRTLSEEANSLNRELDNKMHEIEKLRREIWNISNNPEINGCSIFEAWGTNNYRGEDGSSRTESSQPIRFVAKGIMAVDMARELLGDSYDLVHVSGCHQPL